MFRRGFALAVSCGAMIVSLAAIAPPALAGKVCTVPGLGVPIDKVWKPDMHAAISYAGTRTGDIAFAVRTWHRFYGYRPDHQEWSASVVKAMLLAAYLDQPSVANRQLNGNDYSLLDPMITVSDNNAAQQVFNMVGQSGLWGIAHKVHMSHFATDPVWGKTRITPRDQTSYFIRLPSYIATDHQWYAMHLLASITPSQRWGIGEVAPKGWKLYFKGGWGSGTGLIDNQVALLTRGCERVSIAVLSMNDGSHPYGKDTLKGIFERLLRHFPTGQPPALKGPQGAPGA